MTSEHHLERVVQEAKNLEAARLSLAYAIRAAHQAGLSLRAIARAAGISHELVRRIVSA